MNTESVLIYFKTPEIAALYSQANLKPQTPTSVACDLICPLDIEIPELLGTAFIDFGVSIKVPSPDYFTMIVPRSSTFKKWGIIQTNHCGIIDPDYCGVDDFLGMNIQCTKKIPNDKDLATYIPKGSRVAQILVLPRISFEFKPQEIHWGDKSRGGFGSTGTC